MRSETIMLGAMPAYVAHPDAEPRGGVLVFQEAFGVNEHIMDVTRRVATAGYLAIAPAMFHRTAGNDTFDYGNFDAIRPHMMAVTDDGTLDDADAAIAWLRAQGIGDAAIGVVGFCLGGRMTFVVAAARALGASVTFYGGGIVNGRTDAMPSLLPQIPSMGTPWLGLFGDRDQGIPVEEVERLHAEMKAAPVAWDIVRYPGAGHGFHCDARPQAFDAHAAADGWSRTLEWFGRHIP